MTKSSLVTSSKPARSATPAGQGQVLPAQREGSTCDLYAPGHQMHYEHQGNAVRSPARTVNNAILDGVNLRLLLEDGQELRWRHHDPERLSQILELVPGKRVAYPDFHALRVGPYWFNCATETDDWQDCRPLGAPR